MLKMKYTACSNAIQSNAVGAILMVNSGSWSNTTVALTILWSFTTIIKAGA